MAQVHQFKTKLWPIIIIMTICSVVIGQEKAVIKGRVVDQEGNGIPNLHVMILDTRYADATDTTGAFVIPNLPHGKYTIIFDHIGYQNLRLENINIEEGTTIDFNPIQLQSAVIQMDNVVVTATRTERDIYDIPQSLNVIPNIKLFERASKTSAEALREEPGLFIQKTGHGGGSAIIRGLNSNQILILVDGIRLNNSTYRLGNHNYLTLIDYSGLDKMEVVRGPGSVLYGSDALGGIIHALTSIPERNETQSALKYRLTSRFATADQEKTSQAQVNYNNKILTLYSGFRYSSFGDLHRGANRRYPRIETGSGSTRQHPTGFREFHTQTKCIFNPDPEHAFILAYQFAQRSHVPRFDKYEYDGYHNWLYHPLERQLLYTTYQHQREKSWLQRARLTLSYHLQTEGRKIQKQSESPVTFEKDRVNTIGFLSQFYSEFVNHKVTWGFDLYWDAVSSVRYTTIPGSKEKTNEIRGRYPDGATYNSQGVYIQDEYTLYSSLSAVAGLRWSQFYSKFTIRDSVQSETLKPDFDAWTASLGLVYRFNDHLFLNGHFAQGFRAPNLSDLTKFGESKGNIFEVPNPRIKPEKINSIDLSARMVYNRFKAEVTGYTAQINQILTSVNGTYKGSETIERNGEVYQVKFKDNLGSATIQGLEIGIQWNLLSHLQIFSNWTLTHGQNTTINEPVGGIPPAFGLAGLRWEMHRRFVETLFRFAGSQTRLSSDDMDDPRIPKGGTPGWLIWNIRSGVPLGQWGTILFAIENILDINYREHGSGINGPGRNIIIELRTHTTP